MRIRTVLEVVQAGSRQSGLQLLLPFMVGLGEPPYLVRRQVEVAERLAEWLAVLDRVEKLLP
jgi:hypothetical protein